MKKKTTSKETVFRLSRETRKISRLRLFSFRPSRQREHLDAQKSLGRGYGNILSSAITDQIFGAASKPERTRKKSFKERSRKLKTTCLPASLETDHVRAKQSLRL